ncbi:MAG: prepilin-type N-terminal cleavage/methylation domain-containing protein [Phycisphaerales bacterium]|nr:MAG: prepilin-type N-terminal cleavage/methylation domain-containing protein [Phycisphaerales bacterium]
MYRNAKKERVETPMRRWPNRELKAMGLHPCIEAPLSRQASCESGLDRPDGACGLRVHGRGFTIMEIVIVIVIIAIAAAMAVPMMSSAGSMQIRSAANAMAADIEYAKSMAISKGQYFSVVFDKNAESYQIEDQSGAVIPHPVKKGFNYIVSFANDRRLSKVDIVDADFDSGSEVKFDYLGSPYNGADNPLNSGTVSLQAGSATRTISVEPVTGYVSIGN